MNDNRKVIDFVQDLLRWVQRCPTKPVMVINCYGNLDRSGIMNALALLLSDDTYTCMPQVEAFGSV